MLFICWIPSVIASTITYEIAGTATLDDPSGILGNYPETFKFYSEFNIDLTPNTAQNLVYYNIPSWHIYIPGYTIDRPNADAVVYDNFIGFYNWIDFSPKPPLFSWGEFNLALFGVTDITNLQNFSYGELTIVQAIDSDINFPEFYIHGDIETITSSKPVPEPATLLLFGTGIAGLAAVRRKHK